MKRKRAIILVLIALTITLITVFIIIQNIAVLKQITRNILQNVGLEDFVLSLLSRLGLATPPLPEVILPVIPENHVSVRKLIVASLHEALATKDYKKAAFLNGILSQEAYQRSYLVLKAWEQVRDPETGLVPFATHQRTQRWEPEHTAADLYPFLLLASSLLDPEMEALWKGIINSEREICGQMPCAIQFQPTQISERDFSAQIFGASEYVKDGLLAISERLGEGPWLVRMEEVVKGLIEASSVQTSFGPIPSNDAEINGEMLLVLTRLYWMNGEDQYLTMAERIAEVYLKEVLPQCNNLPPMSWDFENGEPLTSEVSLRDHGAEIIPGLVEVYLLEKQLNRKEAEEFRDPIKNMLDSLLSVERTADNLWYSSVDYETGQPIDSRIVDTWGYVLSAYQTFNLAEGSTLYANDVEAIMRTVSSYRSYPWEGELQDGFADTIESMIYLLPWYDIYECHRWVDDEIEVLYMKQLPSGFIEEWYLDGNFIRTSLLYAAYKSQGITSLPWRWDIQLGAAYDRIDNELYVHISAEELWSGALRFDSPRHERIWNIPIEYPRINGTPEWFVVIPEYMYEVFNLETGDTSLHSGNELIAGFPISLGDDGNTSASLKIIPVDG